MHPARLTRPLLLAVAVSLGAQAIAAESKSGAPEYGLPTPSDLTPEVQARILKAFEAADPHLRMFARHFPGARFSMVRAEPKTPHIIIATTVEFGRFSVSLVFSGSFDGDFRKVLLSRCTLFGAYDNLHESKPKETRRPLPLRLDDMGTFCREPHEFLARQFGLPTP